MLRSAPKGRRCVVKNNLLLKLLDQGSFEVTLHLLFPALDILLMTRYKELELVSFLIMHKEVNSSMLNLEG